MKKVVVTGGNKGIGKAICELLLAKHPDVHVFMTSRNLQRGREAVHDIQTKVGEKCCNERLDLIEMDTCSDDSVKKAASTFDDSSVFGVINNAGIGWGSDTTTGKDIVNTNYFGPRRVNDCFASKMMKPGGRIVNIGSASGPMFVNGNKISMSLGEPWKIPNGVEGLDAFAHEQLSNYDGYDAYGLSKALLSAYTWWHSRKEPSLMINSITPGFIDTELTAGMGASNPPSKGAEPVVWLLMRDTASLDKVPTGWYFGSDCKRSPLDVYRNPGDPEYDGPEGPDKL